jgi:hemerythrin superfamily protein
MDALELLRTDHQTVSELFGKAEETKTDTQKERLFEQIRAALEAHTHIEETIFYPALEEREELKDLVTEAYEEHKQVKTLLREIGNLSDRSERFDAKLKVMQENVEHHVEEEENEMFPMVEDLFSESELAELGAQMEAAKKETSKRKRSTAASKRK